ncbi:MAG: hypothetical protein JEZ11_23260 [Desulfobacterales bacterium]|nr:hypothetical protein [Desulfobacterales bacterium]
MKPYLTLMPRVLRLDPAVFREIRDAGLALWACVVNVALFGLFYGLSAVHFSGRMLDTANPETGAAFNPLAVVLVGVSVAFLMHGGGALFIWVFCRGMGGTQHFMGPYLNLGVAAIALWPLAPALGAIQSGQASIVMQFWAVFATLYGAAVAYVAVREVAGLSDVKMAAAAAATVGYVGCFLYLWL